MFAIILGSKNDDIDRIMRYFQSQMAWQLIVFNNNE